MALRADHDDPLLVSLGRLLAALVVGLVSAGQLDALAAGGAVDGHG